MPLFMISEKKNSDIFVIFQISINVCICTISNWKDMARIITQLLLQVYITIHGGKMNYLLKKKPATFLLTVTDESYEK